MARSKHLICGVHITERLKHALEVQQILTEFGGNIKTRLGLHELSVAGEGPNGLLVIEFVGTDATFKKFTQKLGKVVGVEVKQMVFDHP
ncbi:MAG TPA: hypothetical protein VMT62_04765 [Syntrophorhabdaceae bacterium]|nr:hypothetical protein [Syntrophorhabdaceae bacterium]